MESRLKRLLHRKDNKAASGSYAADESRGEVSTVPYNDTRTGVPPVEGPFPIKSQRNSTSSPRTGQQQESTYPLEDPTVTPSTKTSRDSRDARTPTIRKIDDATPGYSTQTLSAPQDEVDEDIGEPSPQSISFAQRSAKSTGKYPDKPLPPRPGTNVRERDLEQPTPDSTTFTQPGSSESMSPPFAVSANPRSAALDGPSDVDTVLSRSKFNSEDTDITEHMAPAVTHETVHKQIHHIREEVTTREIHNHDVYHRVLPVKYTEVLPARHFITVEGSGLVEVNEEDVELLKHEQLKAETRALVSAAENAPAEEQKRFVGKGFRGSQELPELAQKSTAPEGFERTEQTWVHQPELAAGGTNADRSLQRKLGDLSLHDDKNEKNSTKDKI